MRYHPEHTLDDDVFISAVRQQVSQLPDEVKIFHLLNPQFFYGDPAIKDVIDKWVTFHEGRPANEAKQLTRILSQLCNASPKPAYDESVGTIIFGGSLESEGNTVGMFRTMTVKEFKRDYRFKLLNFNSFDFLIDIGLMLAMPEAES